MKKPPDILLLPTSPPTPPCTITAPLSPLFVCRSLSSLPPPSWPGFPQAPLSISFMKDKTSISALNRAHDEQIHSQLTALPLPRGQIFLLTIPYPHLIWAWPRTPSSSFRFIWGIKLYYRSRSSQRSQHNYDYCPNPAIYELQGLLWVNDSSSEHQQLSLTFSVWQLMRKKSTSGPGDITPLLNLFSLECYTWFVLLPLFVAMMVCIAPRFIDSSLTHFNSVFGSANGRGSINYDHTHPHPSHICIICLIHPSQYLMSNLSPNSTLSLPNSPDGCTDCQDHVPAPDNPAQSRDISLLDGIRPHSDSQPDSSRPFVYADALKYGLGSNSHPQVPPPVPITDTQFPRSHPADPQPRDHSPCTSQPPVPDPSMTHSQPPRIHMDELLNCCLLGKVWGEPLPLPAIIHKTRKDWHFVKGHVEYIDAGNEWVMIRFANAADRMLVYNQRPWHVNGLNFVLHKWSPFFDPYFTSITHIDQWIRIPRLPWEFWDADSLAHLLNHVGPIVNIDQNTLLRLKGKFARVCINIDITHPLPGSLTIARDGLSMRVPLIYEGLHEVCPLCGGESHQLDSCPKLPSQQKIEVMVQKYDDTEAPSLATAPSKATKVSTAPLDNWVTVSPKKRARATQGPHQRKNSLLNPQTSTLPPNPVNHPPVTRMNIPPERTKKPKMQPPPSSDSVQPPIDSAIPPLGVNSPLQNPDIDVDDMMEEGVDAEENVDLYLNLENIEDVEMSTDSAKRKRLEEGEECSSHA